MTSIDVEPQFQRALEHYASGRLRECEGACREILAVSPEHGGALHLLGTIAHRAGFVDEAIGLVHEAVQREPQVAAYRSNLGVMLCAAGHYDDAARACEEALALDPAFFDAHFNLGNALAGAGRFDEAAVAFRRALGLRFDAPQVHNNLGNALKEAGEPTQAVGAFRQALFFMPDYAHARSNLANALEEMRRFAEAEAEHRAAVEAAPASAELHSNLIAGLALGDHAADVPGECERWDERHAVPLLAFVAPHANDPTEDRALRVGFLLPDPRLHEAAAWLLPVLRARDRSAVHATIYALSAASDAVSTELRKVADAWMRVAGVPDEALAQRIRSERIDVLVDLAGHDRSNRLALFARKPAPVQLAGPAVAVTSARCLDGRIAWVAPTDSDAGSADAAVAEEPPGAETPPVRFCHRGPLRRISPRVVAAWTTLLHELPASRLVVGDRTFRDPDVLAAFAGSFGDAASRLDLVDTSTSASGYSELLHDVDVVLATSTLGDAMLVRDARANGLPVVAFGRLEADRDRALDMPFIPTEDDVASHVARAARLVRSGRRSRPAAVAASDRSAIDDTRLSRAFEAECREAWQRWCRSARR